MGGIDRRARSPRRRRITRSFVNRLLRLTLLAPDIQEAILDGRQPKGMQLEELTGAMPMRMGGAAEDCPYSRLIASTLPQTVAAVIAKEVNAAARAMPSKMPSSSRNAKESSTITRAGMT